MILGAHAIVYSADAEADRAFFRDVLGFRGVDAGEGWLIFALPPSELAVHPAEANGDHEIYLMTDDLAKEIKALARHGIATTEPVQLGWGRLTHLTLPGGGKLGLYQPRHPLAHGAAGQAAARPRAATGKPAKPAKAGKAKPAKGAKGKRA